MKDMQKNARHHRGSVLDLLLILLIVLSVLGIFWREHRAERAKDQQQSVAYTLYAQTPPMDAMTFECIRVGDILYTSAGERFGEITALERIPSKISLLSGGVYCEGEWDETLRCEARMEITVQAVPTERGILVAGYRNTVGGVLPSLYSDYAVLRLTLYKMNALDYG
ncbi:MAG: DUF4330 family protein [Clostridia bacterium]|nr:DUF4330 family protein [Clostridia bacterium]